MNSYAVYPFPFDQLKIGYQGDAVTLLMRTSEPVRHAGRTALTDAVFHQITEYLNGLRLNLQYNPTVDRQPTTFPGTPL